MTKVPFSSNANNKMLSLYNKKNKNYTYYQSGSGAFSLLFKTATLSKHHGLSVLNFIYKYFLAWNSNSKQN